MNFVELPVYVKSEDNVSYEKVMQSFDFDLMRVASFRRDRLKFEGNWVDILKFILMKAQ